MGKGDAYVAAAGSSHDDFETDTGATYLSIFSSTSPSAAG